jgi:hypothetical protein
LRSFDTNFVKIGALLSKLSQCGSGSGSGSGCVAVWQWVWLWLGGSVAGWQWLKLRSFDTNFVKIGALLSKLSQCGSGSGSGSGWVAVWQWQWLGGSVAVAGWQWQWQWLGPKMQRLKKGVFDLIPPPLLFFLFSFFQDIIFCKKKIKHLCRF